MESARIDPSTLLTGPTCIGTEILNKLRQHISDSLVHCHSGGKCEYREVDAASCNCHLHLLCSHLETNLRNWLFILLARSVLYFVLDFGLLPCFVCKELRRITQFFYSGPKLILPQTNRQRHLNLIGQAASSQRYYRKVVRLPDLAPKELSVALRTSSSLSCQGLLCLSRTESHSPPHSHK